MRSITVMLFEAAASSVTSEDLDAMEANIREAELTDDSHQRSITLIQFYNVLAAATGNKILVLIANVLVEILQQWVVRMGPVNPEFVIRSRRSIVKHLRLGDSRSAFKELKQFLDKLHDYWLNGTINKAADLDSIRVKDNVARKRT
jgi:DNA-binding FadR family transcriptional regulator